MLRRLFHVRAEGVMTKRFAAVILIVAAMFSAGVQTQGPPKKGGGNETAQAPSPQPSPTTLMMRGTIEKYDASTRILSLSSATGTVQFPVPLTVRVRKGWHRLDAAALEKLPGLRAAVRYSQSGGDKIVESVHVFDK
jgi:hypothetical protein